MPAFNNLADDEIKAIVDYLRILGGRSPGVPLAGNAARGKELFFGEAGCSHCHLMNGAGGFLGSDLTAYSVTQTSGELNAAILDPERLHDQRVAWVEITTRAGERLAGVLRNEDNFSLQVLSADGTLHLLMKSEAAQLSRKRLPVMPAGGRVFSPSQIEDLISYLVSAAPRAAVHPRRPTPRVGVPSASSLKPPRPF